ncbi:MAG: hypothetical protein Q9195_009265 [Heterodermia aff. obscurata]
MSMLEMNICASEININNNRKCYETDSDTVIKSERSVSPTRYVPIFPNLPSGVAWHARQKALGNPYLESATLPKHKRPSVSQQHAESAVVIKKESKGTPSFQPLDYESPTNITTVGSEMDDQESDKYSNTTSFAPPVRPYRVPKGKLWVMPPSEVPVRVQEHEGPIRRLRANELGDIAVVHGAKDKAKEGIKIKTEEQDPKPQRSKAKHPKAKPESSKAVADPRSETSSMEPAEYRYPSREISAQAVALLRAAMPDYTPEEEEDIVRGFLTKLKTDDQAKELAAMLERGEIPRGGR